MKTALEAEIRQKATLMALFDYRPSKWVDLLMFVLCVGWLAQERGLTGAIESATGVGVVCIVIGRHVYITAQYRRKLDAYIDLMGERAVDAAFTERLRRIKDGQA